MSRRARTAAARNCDRGRVVVAVAARSDGDAGDELAREGGPRRCGVICIRARDQRKLEPAGAVEVRAAVQHAALISEDDVVEPSRRRLRN